MTGPQFLIAGKVGGAAICDFCSSPDVRWAFPTRDFTTKAQPTRRTFIEATMYGGWAACPACHALILRGDRIRLARRSAKRMQRLHGIRVPLKLIEAQLRVLHDDFWANREGAPIPADPTSPDPTRS
jgi:hypothetical protein